MKNNDNNDLIIFDIDGTLTNFEGFVKRYSPKYFKKHYGLSIVNEHGYDVDEVYNLHSIASKDEVKKIMQLYWMKYYIQYIHYPLRKGTNDAIHRLIKEDEPVEFYSSRDMTCKSGMIGFVARTLMFYQLSLLANIPNATQRLKLFPNDEEKIASIKALHNPIVIDDKPKVINEISDCSRVVAVETTYSIGQINHDKVIMAEANFGSGVYDAIQKLKKIGGYYE